jgi:hypothetical protein
MIRPSTIGVAELAQAIRRDTSRDCGPRAALAPHCPRDSTARAWNFSLPTNSFGRKSFRLRKATMGAPLHPRARSAVARHRPATASFLKRWPTPAPRVQGRIRHLLARQLASALWRLPYTQRPFDRWCNDNVRLTSLTSNTGARTINSLAWKESHRLRQRHDRSGALLALDSRSISASSS